MTTRIRLILLAAVVVVVVAVAGVSIGRMRLSDSAQASGPAIAVVDLPGVLAQPHVVFRSTALGPDYGRLSAAPLDHPDQSRAMTEVTCQRVYATASAG
ncbi:MAG: hypothetical protein ABWY56_10830, partial [Propionibacteriaceae bacterium]